MTEMDVRSQETTSKISDESVGRNERITLDSFDNNESSTISSNAKADEKRQNNERVSSGGTFRTFSGEHERQTPTEGNNKIQNKPTPSCLEIFLEGANVPLNTRVPIQSRPLWLDDEKLKRGRLFATRHLFGLVYSEFMSLALLFSFRGGLEPLIYTGKSDTPYNAFRRYLSTVTRVVSWYEGDVWEDGSVAQKNMAAVRNIHAAVAKRMNETPREEIAPKVTLEGRGKGLWCPYIHELKKDFTSIESSEDCPFAALNSLSRNNHSECIYVNQLDLLLTQFGFLGLMVLFPERFGARGASDEDLEGFVHLWRGFGYLLGIEDRYNFCAGGLEETRDRSRAVLENWVKPGLRGVTAEWEHMFRCVVEGVSYYVPGNTFGGGMAYLCWVIDVPIPHLYATMSWYERFFFNLNRFVLGYVLRIPGSLAYHNWLLRMAMKRARSASPSWLRSKKDKVYDHQREASMTTHL